MNKMILSLDGGGIRGAASAQFLSRVEDRLKREYGKSIRDYVDFYAGTSTGSIIALALATTKLTVNEICNLYNHENARAIFTDNRGFLEIDGINAPKYESKNKTRVLKNAMREARLRDVASGKHVLVVTYAIEKRQPMVIKSTDTAYRELLSYRIADASSAAPTYFPTRRLSIGNERKEVWLVDGGVVANNPTMCAIAEAKREWDTSIDEMRILSVGTGYRSRKINGPESRNWGAIGWFVRGQILDLLTDERIVAYQAITLARKGTYIRVDSDMEKKSWMQEPPDDAMDDISRSNILKLKRMGDYWFEQYGDSTVALLTSRYSGPSLDSIERSTGMPKRHG
ncbi:patatin [Synechococcus sp. RSCCF101]|uniref:patatin-like phospholipase family protein n=1 Tax=Synechococcus sp. RSCCF101 TaxID=2511069 RepID=UPI001244AA1E|nr:patatin-like phospholipase family protein [Synechococcus sp. RSCCF101]QEY31192.1 patatin [Synechococcus sp. RSCCF101]